MYAEETTVLARDFEGARRIPVVLHPLAELQVSCSGTTIGSYRCMRDYLTQMVEAILENPTPCQGVDQGFHNYVVHSGRVPNVSFCSNRDGPFLTLHGVYDWKWGESGDVLLPSGQVANIVHQFNRHPELVSLAKRRFGPGPLLSGSLQLIREVRRLTGL